MNPGLIFIPVAAFFASKFAKAAKNAADKLVYQFKDVDFSLKGINKIEVTFTVAIKNPTTQSIWFDRLEAVASWNTYTLGNATVKNRILIHADQTTIFKIPFQVNSIELILAVVAAIKAKSMGSATISGTIYSGAIKTPFNQTLNAKKKP